MDTFIDNYKLQEHLDEFKCLRLKELVFEKQSRHDSLLVFVTEDWILSEQNFFVDASL